MLTEARIDSTDADHASTPVQPFERDPARSSEAAQDLASEMGAFVTVDVGAVRPKANGPRGRACSHEIHSVMQELRLTNAGGSPKRLCASTCSLLTRRTVRWKSPPYSMCLELE